MHGPSRRRGRLCCRHHRRLAHFRQSHLYGFSWGVVQGLGWGRTEEAETNKRAGSWCQGTAEVETEEEQVGDVQHLEAVRRSCGETRGHTHVRPYISERGPRNRGPMAKERRKMLRVNAMIVVFVMSYFKAMSGRPGAIMELARGLTNV